MAIGACSREDPHPKFFPATRKSPGDTYDATAESISSMQCRASSAGSEVFRYRAGMMTSVSTSSPYFHAFPLSCMPALLRGQREPLGSTPGGGLECPAPVTPVRLGG